MGAHPTPRGEGAGGVWGYILGLPQAVQGLEVRGGGQQHCCHLMDHPILSIHG